MNLLKMMQWNFHPHSNLEMEPLHLRSNWTHYLLPAAQ